MVNSGVDASVNRWASPRTNNPTSLGVVSSHTTIRNRSNRSDRPAQGHSPRPMGTRCVHRRVWSMMAQRLHSGIIILPRSSLLPSEPSAICNRRLCISCLHEASALSPLCNHRLYHPINGRLDLGGVWEDWDDGTTRLGHAWEQWEDVSDFVIRHRGTNLLSF